MGSAIGYFAIHGKLNESNLRSIPCCHRTCVAMCVCTHAEAGEQNNVHAQDDYLDRRDNDEQAGEADFSRECGKQPGLLNPG